MARGLLGSNDDCFEKETASDYMSMYRLSDHKCHIPHNKDTPIGKKKEMWS